MDTKAESKLLSTSSQSSSSTTSTSTTSSSSSSASSVASSTNSGSSSSDEITPGVMLDFWFDRRAGQPLAQRMEWWKKDTKFDDHCRQLYGNAVEKAIKKNGFDEWCTNAEGSLALVLLLDQLPRNIYRGDPASFSGDERALRVARAAIERGDDRKVDPIMRAFFYLPFEHSENMADQEYSCRLFESMATSPTDLVLDYARRHRDIIARFGRFPHRNIILGRTSTPGEIEFLKQPGSSF